MGSKIEGGPPRGVVRRALTFGVLTLGWLVFIGALSLLWLEWSGMLARITAREVARRYDLEPDQLTIGGADVRLSKRCLVLTDVELGDPADLRFDAVELRLGWSAARGTFLERALVDGGHLKMSQALTAKLEGVGRRAGDAGRGMDQHLPTVVARRFHVSVETDDGELVIGRVDAFLREDTDGIPRLLGRLKNAMAQPSDEPGDIYLSGRLLEGRVLDVRGAARGLELSTAYLPRNTPLEGVRDLDPRGLFDLEARARYTVGTSVLPEASVSVRVTGGSLRLPHLDDSRGRPVEDLALDLELSFTPTETKDPWDPAAWSGTAHSTASWQGTSAEVFARVGRDAPAGNLGEAWIHVPRLALDESLLELAGDAEILQGLWAMLEPRGAVGLSIAARLSDEWTKNEDFLSAVDRSLVINAAGDASCAYVGTVNRFDGRRNLGFPLRVEGMRGAITYTWHEGRLRPEEVGLFALAGRHAGGPVNASGQLIARPLWLDGLTGGVPRIVPRFHLFVHGEDVRIDEDARVAFRGLEGIEAVRGIYPSYSPSGGDVDFDLETWINGERRGLATALDVSLDGVGFECTPFPLAMEKVDGTVALRTDGRSKRQGRVSLAIDVEGSTAATRGAVEIAGRVEAAPLKAVTSMFRVRAKELDLANAFLREALTKVAPGAIDTLDATGAGGHVDVSAMYAQPVPHGQRFTWTEILSTADGLAADFVQFPVEAQRVSGRILVTSTDPPGGPDPAATRTDTRASLHGFWNSLGADVPVAVDFVALANEGTQVRALGAGLDVTDPAVRDSLIRAFTQGGGQGEAQHPGETPDPSLLDLSGHIDFETAFRLGPDANAEPEDLEVGLLVRLPRLGLGEVRLLRDLEGRFRYEAEDGAWVGERLNAELGSTPVELKDFRWDATPAGSRITARLYATGLPIDEEHLQYFFDEATLRTLLSELAARGNFDVDGGLLTLETARDAATSVSFEGRLVVNDMYVNLGLPISSSAEEVDLDLYFEEGRMRARARIRELYGKIAGRKLERAKMQVTYIEPRLWIGQLESRFEGGHLRSLGHASTTGGSFFSVDLQPPFAFALSAEMEDVDLGGLLAGVFNSNFANEGRLNGKMRLNGDIENLLDARGSGRIELSNSSLWAIPVFQELFTQLGFDTTAVFRTMSSQITVADGALNMTRIQVESDLLSLVGEGSVTLEGRLHHDLEVRYSLVDKLGPLKRLLYEIQNSLLRVSIRGDMSRPHVVLGGFFSSFLQRRKSDQQRLPLPALSGLPTRF